MLPEEELLVAFWQCIHSDLEGNGVASDKLPNRQRRLPYAERVIIERTQLSLAAQNFIESPDFEWWADQSGLDANRLRGQLHAANPV